MRQKGGCLCKRETRREGVCRLCKRGAERMRGGGIVVAQRQTGRRGVAKRRFRDVEGSIPYAKRRFRDVEGAIPYAAGDPPYVAPLVRGAGCVAD